MAVATDEVREVRKEFKAAVNMTASQLEKWLDSKESRSVGAVGGTEKKTGTSGGEATGHKSGRRIVQILGKKQADLTEADVEHMRKVVGYVNRHLAQRPKVEDVKTSRWRYSLMNWGHDPLKG